MSSEIKLFYSKTNVLITGATGLFGKILIQKLLQTCVDISAIYVIVREKRGRSTTQRMEEMYKDTVFSKLKEANPGYSKKIQIVAGDCSQPGLGLNPVSRKLLTDKINIVFHCAATLNMDAKMKDAVDTNVRGLSELLDLCHEMRYLKSMVFVSTAYSNCTQYVIKEQFYEAPIQATTLMKLTEEINENILDSITPRLIDKWPNTYCFTKAIAENIVYTKAGDLPVGVFRPSIVMPTYADPVPGWISNLYGPVGVMVTAALGILRVFYAGPHNKFDFVPVDLCVNALICSAWEINHQRLFANMIFMPKLCRENLENPTQQQIPVFNYSGGPEKNITWNVLMKTGLDHQYPLRSAMWVTTLTLTDNSFYYNMLWFFLHTIPGYLVDMYLLMTGQKPRLVKAYKKIAKFSQVLAFFTTREWDIVHNNIDNLWRKLNKTDKELFPFDMNTIDYKKYIQGTCLGIKVHIMKENLDNAEAEMNRYQRLLWIHNIIKSSIKVFLLAVLYQFLSLSISEIHKLVY